ncbi:MAG: class I SAM-dependent methyltransferase [Chitinispirillaceae bacterium]
MISVPPQNWVDEDQELRRYDLHDNTLSNNGYVKYLSQMMNETEKLKLDDPFILDFGSGPDAVLASLLKNIGYRAEGYDPLFGLELKRGEKFDLVIMCEVIEHLRDIRKELELVRNVLCPGGMLLLRTQLYPSLEMFSNWWYTQDPTHINFFSEKSLQKVASFLGMELVGTSVKDIFLLK